jgi:hypothetical protein
MRYFTVLLLGFVAASRVPIYETHLKTPLETFIDIRREAATASVETISTRFYGYEKDKSDVRHAAEFAVAQAKLLRAVRSHWGSRAEHRLILRLQIDDEALDLASRVVVKSDHATIWNMRGRNDFDSIEMKQVDGEWKIDSWNCEPRFEGFMTLVLHDASVDAFNRGAADIESGKYATYEAAEDAVSTDITKRLEPFMEI